MAKKTTMERTWMYFVYVVKPFTKIMLIILFQRSYIQVGEQRYLVFDCQAICDKYLSEPFADTIQNYFFENWLGQDIVYFFLRDLQTVYKDINNDMLVKL